MTVEGTFLKTSKQTPCAAVGSVLGNGHSAAVDAIREFKRALKGRKPSTVRLYVAGAKAAMKAVKAKAPECQSYAELLAAIREIRLKKSVRVAPFLRFLEDSCGGGATESMPPEDIRGIQYWVIQTLAKRLRALKNPSIAARRDMALIAALCCAPERGNPRHWPQSALQISGGSEVLLWSQKIEEPAFALSLRFWHAWRERLARPDQRQLYRKSTEWSHSKLLFPGPRGQPLGRSVLHNALRRLVNGVGEGSRLRPQKIRAAFRAGGGLFDIGSCQESNALAPL